LVHHLKSPIQARSTKPTLCLSAVPPLRRLPTLHGGVDEWCRIRLQARADPAIHRCPRTVHQSPATTSSERAASQKGLRIHTQAPSKRQKRVLQLFRPRARLSKLWIL